MKRILIFIIPLLFFCCKTDKSIEISKTEFEEKILIPGDLLKYYIYSDAVFSDPEIRIFIKPDSLHLPRHKSVKNIKEEHQYSLKIVGYESFYNYISRRCKELGLLPIEMRPFKIME